MVWKITAKKVSKRSFQPHPFCKIIRIFEEIHHTSKRTISIITYSLLEVGSKSNEESVRGTCDLPTSGRLSQNVERETAIKIDGRILIKMGPLSLAETHEVRCVFIQLLSDRQACFQKMGEKHQDDDSSLWVNH